jgi:hypothetical protein
MAGVADLDLLAALAHRDAVGVVASLGCLSLSVNRMLSGAW